MYTPLKKDNPKEILEIHVGQLLWSQVKKSEKSTADIARQLGTSPNNLYKIYKKKDIDTFIIKRFGKALGQNIFSIIAGELGKELDAKSVDSSIALIKAIFQEKNFCDYCQLKGKAGEEKK